MIELDFVNHSFRRLLSPEGSCHAISHYLRAGGFNASVPSHVAVPVASKALDASALSASAFGALSFLGGMISLSNNHSGANVVLG